MLGKSKICRLLFAGLVAVVLSGATVFMTGCPEENGFEEPAEPALQTEVMDLFE